MSSVWQYLTLGLAHETFGIDIEYVHEILDYRTPAALPQAPDFLAGMIDVRGQSYPVVDLRTKLGLPPAAPTASTRIILLSPERVAADPVQRREAMGAHIGERVYSARRVAEQHHRFADDRRGIWRIGDFGFPGGHVPRV